MSKRLTGLALAATLAAVAVPAAAGPVVCPEVARAQLEIAKVQHVVRGYDVVASDAAWTPAPGVQLDKMLARLEDEWTVASDAANILLDDALLDVGALSNGQRAMVRAELAKHIAEAEAGLASAITRHTGETDAKRAALDRIEIAEYLVTCERLREVHALLADAFAA